MARPAGPTGRRLSHSGCYRSTCARTSRCGPAWTKSCRRPAGSTCSSTTPDTRSTGAAEETSLAEAKAQFETNFFGTVRMVNAVLPGMRKAGAGRIVNIGSLVGLTAIPFSAFYCATKFALEAYSEALWHELRPFGITVTLVEPGFVHTRMTEAAQLVAGPLPAYEGPRRRVIAAMGRSVERGIAPEQVARCVLRIVESRAPRLRYRVGAEATWLPRLKNAAPWTVFAAGVRRRFAVDAST